MAEAHCTSCWTAVWLRLRIRSSRIGINAPSGCIEKAQIFRLNKKGASVALLSSDAVVLHGFRLFAQGDQPPHCGKIRVFSLAIWVILLVSHLSAFNRALPAFVG